MVNSRWTGPFDRGIPNALTVEVEERWHAAPSRREEAPRAADAVERLLGVLSATGARATFFILGAAAERQPEVVRMVRDAGHELGCHGQEHRPVGSRTPGEFRADLRQGREALRDLSGSAVDAYRAPDFSVTPACRWALDVLVEEGFVFDSSIDPARHDHSGVLATPVEPYAIRREGGSLWELPPPAWPSLSSSRFEPYPLTRLGLRSANAVGRPFVVSVSSWEFDGARAPQTEERLGRLLADFAFAPVSETLARWYERAGPAPRRAAA
jgi:polysaccharide deacetylase family protein (PEP-CTERM system associated)